MLHHHLFVSSLFLLLVLTLLQMSSSQPLFHKETEATGLSNLLEVVTQPARLGQGIEPQRENFVFLV